MVKKYIGLKGFQLLRFIKECGEFSHIHPTIRNMILVNDIGHIGSDDDSAYNLALYLLRQYEKRRR